LTGRSSWAVGISIACWTHTWSTTTPTDHIAGSIWLPRTRLSSTHRQLAPKRSVGETFSAASYTSTTRPSHDGNRVSDPYTLESLAVSHAIPQLEADVARELGALIERVRRTEDARKWLKLNDTFHLRLYQSAGRPRLSNLIGSLRDASAPYIHMFVASRPVSERANEEHQAILEACVRRDASDATRAIRDHLRHASRDLAAFLSRDARDV
jgi:hypothetical protein